MATTAVAKNEMKEMMGFLSSEGAVASLKAACAKHLTPERLLRVVGAAISRNPGLLECTKESFFVAVSCCGQLGLEPNLLGDAYLVPFNNRKTGKKEVQFMPGYRGLVNLARRSGEISTIYAEVVKEGDEFQYELGDTPRIYHKPSMKDGERRGILYVYAVAKLKDGGIQRVVMSSAEVEGIRKRSRAANDGPWVTDYDEMAKKTALRRLSKLLPMTVEFADAVEREIEADMDISASVVSVGPSESASEATGAAAKVRAAAKAKAEEPVEGEVANG